MSYHTTTIPVPFKITPSGFVRVLSAFEEAADLMNLKNPMINFWTHQPNQKLKVGKVALWGHLFYQGFTGDLKVFAINEDPYARVGESAYCLISDNQDALKSFCQAFKIKTGKFQTNAIVSVTI